jgi:hypothetical protein
VWFGKPVPAYGRNVLSPPSGYKMDVTGTSEIPVPKVCCMWRMYRKYRAILDVKLNIFLLNVKGGVYNQLYVLVALFLVKGSILQQLL